MIQILLSKGGNELWLMVLGVLFIFFVLPSIVEAAFNKADKEAKKGNGTCLGAIFIVIIILTIIVWIVELGKCSRGDNYIPEREPRHTYIQKPMQNFVNTSIFN